MHMHVASRAPRMHLPHDAIMITMISQQLPCYRKPAVPEVDRDVHVMHVVKYVCAERRAKAKRGASLGSRWGGPRGRAKGMGRAKETAL